MFIQMTPNPNFIPDHNCWCSVYVRTIMFEEHLPERTITFLNLRIFPPKKSKQKKKKVQALRLEWDGAGSDGGSRQNLKFS